VLSSLNASNPDHVLFGAIVVTMWSDFLRVSEALRLRVSDGRRFGDSAAVVLNSSKTKQGKVATSLLPAYSGVLNASVWIQCHLDFRGEVNPSDFLFRDSSRGLLCRGVTYRSLNSAISDVFGASDGRYFTTTPTPWWSIILCCVRFVSTLKAFGRWKSDAFRHYVVKSRWFVLNWPI